MHLLEPGIRDSISLYEKILTLLQDIEKSLGTASGNELQGMSTSLVELQSRATQHDQLIVDQLTRMPAKNSEIVTSLLARRETLMKKILLLNNELTAKATGVKSLLAHEMRTIRSGRSALSGYKQQQHNQGRIVDSTS